MTTACPDSRQDVSKGQEWQEQRVHSTEDAIRVLDTVLGLMSAAGYSRKDLFAFRLALEEAAINAIKHGNKGDMRKGVRFGYCVTTERVLAEIEDEGTGFDPGQVPDPTAPENLEKPGGRGLLLMRSYATWVRFNERGNCVTLCKEPLKA